MSTAHETTPDAAVLCPACGYDLRGTSEATRCTECGVEVDRARPYSTAWPWMRRGVGAAAAGYALTTAWVAVGHARLALEARKAQDVPAARGFRRVTAYLLAAALLGLWVCGYFVKRPRPFKLDPRWLLADDAAAAVQDWAMPLSTGVTLPGVLPVVIVVLAFRLVGGPGRVLGGGGDDDARQRETGEAIGCYVAGMLAWLVVPAAAFGAYTWAAWGQERSPLLSMRPWVMDGLAWGIVGIAALVVGWTGAWKRRLDGRRWVRAMAALPCVWAWEALIWLALVPWGVGFLWIVWETLR